MHWIHYKGCQWKSSGKRCRETDPPRRGPITLAKEKTPPKVPKRSGRCSSLVAYDTTVMIEVKMPLAPTPAIARPKIYEWIPLISRVREDEAGTYENVHAWCHTTNQAAHFENKNDGQV
jgi:hypothetical protein